MGGDERQRCGTRLPVGRLDDYRGLQSWLDGNYPVADERTRVEDGGGARATPPGRTPRVENGRSYSLATGSGEYRRGWHVPYLVVGLIVTRSFDPRIFKEAVEPYPDSVTLDFDFNKWLTNSNNLMYVSDKDVGLATAEYPGVYNTHWFFKSRGKAALDVAFAMHHKLFAETDARALRGLTPVDLRSARLLAKRMGYETVGIEEFLDGVYDHMVLLKENFMEKWNKRYG